MAAWRPTATQHESAATRTSFRASFATVRVGDTRCACVLVPSAPFSPSSSRSRRARVALASVSPARAACGSLRRLLGQLLAFLGDRLPLFRFGQRVLLGGDVGPG